MIDDAGAATDPFLRAPPASGRVEPLGAFLLDRACKCHPQQESLMPSYPIVGARFRPPAQDVLDNLPAGTKLLLRRQPDNPYDGNAVQVLVSGFEAKPELLDAHGMNEMEQIHLGFIPRESAAKLAPLMDQNGEDSRDALVEWPATLTFAAHGGPMVTFEAPE